MILYKITFTYKGESKNYLRKFDCQKKAIKYIEGLRNKQQNVTYKKLKRI